LNILLFNILFNDDCLKTLFDTQIGTRKIKPLHEKRRKLTYHDIVEGKMIRTDMSDQKIATSTMRNSWSKIN